MALYSPGVEVVEIDASAIVPSEGPPVAVFAGNFEKGPLDQYVYIDTVEDFLEIYGKPKNENYNDWFQVYNFLQYNSGRVAVNRIGGLE
jgi:hypothetical protein